MRHEFTRATKRDALKRSGGRCEGDGAVYGLEPGQRCNALLSHGVEFDHYPDPAGDPGSERLENCCAVCKVCHAHKTRTYDIPMLAKGKRIADNHAGIRKAPTMRSAGFRKAPAQHSATRKITRTTEGHTNDDQ